MMPLELSIIHGEVLASFIMALEILLELGDDFRSFQVSLPAIQDQFILPSMLLGVTHFRLL